MCTARWQQVPAGDTCDTSRFYSAIAAGCVPVVLCDAFIGAFASRAHYSTFWVKPRVRDFAANPAALVRALQEMPEPEFRKRRAALARARKDVLYDVVGSRAGTNFLLAAQACVARASSGSAALALPHIQDLAIRKILPLRAWR